MIFIKAFCRRVLRSTVFSVPIALARGFFSYETILARLKGPQYAFAFRSLLTDRIDQETRKVFYSKLQEERAFDLFTPNQTCLFRQESFHLKEPEIIEWIDAFGGDGTFFDIGANIGLYSIYFALTKNGDVYSFEPSPFNIRQLVKNINVNALDERISIVSNPLSSKTGFSAFINSTDIEGGALNAFGVNFGHDGNPIETAVKSTLLGFKLDDMIDTGAIPEAPALIKIDVDGIEHLILEGAEKTIRNPECKSIYIEVNDSFQEQASEVRRLLTQAGFTLHEKTHAPMYDDIDTYSTTFNQIWLKP